MELANAICALVMVGFLVVIGILILIQITGRD